MGASATRDLLVRLLGESTSLDATFDKTLANFDDMSVKAAAAGAAAIALGTGIDYALDQAAEKANAYGKEVLTVQRLTGLSAEESSKWAAIFERLGVDGTKTAALFKSLSSAVVDHSEKLNALGIATTDQNGRTRDTVDVLADLAEYYSTADDKTVALNNVTSALGKQFKDVIPLLDGGREAIEQWAASAEANGKIFSQEDIDQVKDYNAAVKENEEAIEGLTIKLGLATLPYKTFKTEVIGGLIDDLRELNPELVETAGYVGGVVADVLQVGGGLVTAISLIPDFTSGLGLIATLGGDAAAAIGLLAGGSSIGSVAGLGASAAAATVGVSALAGSLSGLAGFGIGTLITKIPIVNDWLTELGQTLDDTFGHSQEWYDQQAANNLLVSESERVTGQASVAYETESESVDNLVISLQGLYVAEGSVAALQRTAVEAVDARTRAALQLEQAQKRYAEAISDEEYRAAEAKLNQTIEEAGQQRQEIISSRNEKLIEAEEDFREKIADLNEKLGEQISDLWDQYAEQVADRADQIRDAFGGLFGEVPTEIEDAISDAEQQVADAQKRVDKATKALADARKQALEDAQEQAAADSTGSDENQPIGQVRIPVTIDVSAEEESLQDALAALEEAKKALSDAQEQANGQNILNQLESQVATVKEWQAALEELKRRGVSADILEELRSQGPQNIEQVRAMLNLTTDEIKRVNDAWTELGKLAGDEAKNQSTDLYDETREQIAELRRQAELERADLRTQWKTTNEGISADAVESLSKLSSATAESVASQRADLEKIAAEHGKNSEAAQTAALDLREAQRANTDAIAKATKAQHDLLKAQQSSRTDDVKSLKKTWDVAEDVATKSNSAFKNLHRSTSDSFEEFIRTTGAGWDRTWATWSSAGSKFFRIGSDLVDGLKSGWQATFGSLIDVVGSGISKLIDWIRDILGIHSPSTVGHDIGFNLGSTTGKATADGLLSQLGTVGAAAGLVASSMIPAMGSPTLGLSASSMPSTISIAQGAVHIEVHGDIAPGEGQVIVSGTENALVELVREMDR